MSRPKLLVAGIAAVAILLAVLLWPTPPTEEDRVRRAIEAVADGARRADLGDTLAPISQRYRDGELSREQLRGLLFGEYQRRGPITVILSEIAVQVDGAAAHASFNATLASGVDPSSLDLVPDDAQSYDFEVDLALEDGEWKVTSQGHTPVL